MCLALLSALLMPVAARAQSEKTVVRVGWYETPYNQTDAFGRRSGYAYEYQQKIAAYTGWTYEYVKGSWPELMQMLIDGEIDLMSDVSYTVGRSKIMLYSMLPMGAEEYYVFVSAGRDSGISADDIASLEGRRIGVNRGSVQSDMFRKWASKKGISTEIVELTGDEADSIAMLETGEIDGYVAIDAYGLGNGVLPVCKVCASDFFFAVSKSRPELLRGLDAAMVRIQDENAHYNQLLQEKYMRYSGANMFFTESELKWLSAHGSVRVGYLDDYLAFCARDRASGALTGALQSFLTLASQGMQNATVTFEATPFATTSEALEALRRGEIDCVFPVSFTDSDAEDRDVLDQINVMINGQVAVDMFSDHPAGYYDAILMDVRMPVMNGLEAARAIRELSRPDAKEIPIIAMTANVFDEDVQLSLQAGMNAHLSKPVEPERLYETLEQMIGRR